MRTTTDINWHTAGQRDFDLTVITSAHTTDHWEHAAAHNERELIRAHIPNLNDQQLRHYLNALLDQMELFFASAPHQPQTSR